MKNVVAIIALFFLLSACTAQAPEQMAAVQPSEVIEPQIPAPAMEEPTASEPAKVTKVVDVQIKGFRYNPSLVTINAGDTVRWTNEDTARHDATGTGWNTPLLGKGESAEVVFDKPGSYDYGCSVHPSMKAKVIVQ
jgi:plastocyanin